MVNMDVSSCCSRQTRPASISLALVLAILVALSFTRAQDPSSPEVRLVEGPDEHQGVLQYYHPQISDWVDICGDAIQEVDADVACKTLGFHGAGSIRNISRSTSGSDFKALKFVWCDPSYHHFIDCPMSGLLFNASHECRQNAPEVTCLTTRLYGGSEMSSGRVEVWSNGGWGKVCSPDFDEDEQTVACRELGYARRSEVDFVTTQFSDDPTNLPYAWGEVSCTGTEQTLEECRPDITPPSPCPEGGDAHASCATTDRDEDSPPYFAVKLEDGPCETEGRLMVWGGDSYRWGTVCQEMITERDARVICRQLGFDTSSAEVVQCCDTYQKASAGTVKVLDALNCTGSEEMITHCPHPQPGHLDGCTDRGHHDNDVGIRCQRCQSKSVKVGAIVGGIIVVLVIIVIVVLVVWFCWYVPRRKYQEKVGEPDHDVEGEPEGDATVMEPMVENDLDAADLKEKTVGEEE